MPWFPLDISSYQQPDGPLFENSPSYTIIWRSLSWGWFTGLSFSCCSHLRESSKSTDLSSGLTRCISLRPQLSHPLAPSGHQHYNFFISSVRCKLEIKSQKETGTHGIKYIWCLSGRMDRILIPNMITVRQPRIPWATSVCLHFHSSASLLLPSGVKRTTKWAAWVSTGSRWPDLWG